MKYGTPTRLKSIYPFIKELPPTLSKKATIRLKWMEYIFRYKHSVKECSIHFDYPIRTINFWKKRYKPSNLRSLEDRSKRPHTTRATYYDEILVKEVKKIRNKRPWGKVKIQIILKKKGIILGQNKIQKIINKSGLKRVKVDKRKKPRVNRRHMYTVPRKDLNIVGGLVYFDVKHLYLIGYGKVYAFVGIDHCSRCMYANIYKRITSSCGKEFFLYMEERLRCKIINVGSDNGSEFLGDFDKLLSDLNINHVFSSPRSPQQNPFVERVIQNIIKECLEFEGLGYDMQSQQEKIDKYIFDYNNIRPHYSLNNLTPKEKYALMNKSYTI